MRAVGYQTPGQLSDDVLRDVELPEPVATGRDLLVAVDAVSVNPVDTKQRRATPPAPGGWKVLGWDAAGTVLACGPDVTLFAPGDRVFDAGDIGRQGTNSERHLVDERIVGRAPANLSPAEAAALPLTSLTAWEMLFDRLDVRRPVPGAASAIVIVGGAGGVGSIAIQIARALTDLTVIATASRPETAEWARGLGAHHVIDHARPIAAQVAAVGLGAAPGFVFDTTQGNQHLAEIGALIAPQGRLGMIADTEGLNHGLLRTKSISIHWEYMFTRAQYATPDIGAQGAILNRIADLVEEGRIRSTLTEVMGTIDAATLTRAHALIESGTARGKIVLAGF